MTGDLRLPWHRETIGHANIEQIAEQVARDLAVPLPDGIPPHTDATWIVNADNKIVAFVGNGPRQTENGDAIIDKFDEAGDAAATVTSTFQAMANWRRDASDYSHRRHTHSDDVRCADAGESAHPKGCCE